MTTYMLEQLKPLTDEEVVGRVLAGDAALFELLMRRYNQRLFRIARSVLRDDAEAEDVVQETYLRAYANLRKFEGRSSVATWLSRIALHESLRILRRHRRLRKSDTDLDDAAQDNGKGDGINGLIADENRTTVAEAIDSLSVPHRAVVMMRLVEGLSTEETAKALRLTESNVKVTLHRAKQVLSESMLSQIPPDLRREFCFGEKRCDRMVEQVFQRLGLRL